MSKNWILVPTLALLAFAGSIAVVKADEAKKDTDYAALAVKYDKLAAAQDAIIHEHASMKVEKARMHPGKPGISVNAAMDKHCDAIIRDAKKLKADYKAFADWCRLMVKEGLK